jgi:DNA-binding NtrC family response regulator
MDVVSITLPPLRQRKADIPDFCRAFLRAFNTVHHKDIKDLSPAAYQKIFGHAWPGNIRELKNTLERAVIFCEEANIGEELIKFSMEAGLPAPPARVRRPYQFSKISLEEVKTLLAKHRGNMKEAAAELGVPRRTLYHKLKQLGVSVSDLRRRI